MTIRNITLRTDELAPVLLRRPFEQAMTREKTPAVTQDGQPIHYAEAIVPGLVTGRFSFEPMLGSVRLRVLGSAPGVGAGVVRLEGRVTMSATYGRGQRMSDRTSHLTITAERVRQTDERPGGRGFLPAELPVAGVLMDARPQNASEPAGRWVADLALDATGAYTVEGLAEFVSMIPVADHLIGATVRPVDLRARYTAPDSMDVNQRNRAELLLSCSGFDTVGAPPSSSSSRRNRVEEPQPEAAPA